MTGTHWTIVYAKWLLATDAHTIGSDTRPALIRRYADARAWTRGRQDRINADMMDASMFQDMDSLRELTRNAEAAVRKAIRLYNLPDDNEGTEETDA